MTIEEEIRRLEEEIRNTQYNKATSHHIGRLKAKIARLRQDQEKRSAAKAKKAGVRKAGDATTVLIGPIGTGKSTLHSVLTGARASEDPYDLNTTPGILSHQGAKIQVLDVPDLIIAGGEAISTIRDSDLIILVNAPGQDLSPYLEALYQNGIRINQSVPGVLIRRTTKGGITVTSTVDPGIDQGSIEAILKEYRIHSADVLIREALTQDRFIDALESNRKYLQAITVMNKSDFLDPGELAALPGDVLPISAREGLGLDRLKDGMFEQLELMRIYMKPQGGQPDLKEPMIMRNGNSVADLCDCIHRDFRERFRYATVWGSSAKHDGQRVGLEHMLSDGDIVTIVIQK
ncbi:MAG: TGS domain-containing protein [Methanosarcinales archaeon]|nr:TGS domain-containing protein [Methanosarcinales archaeon]